MPTTTYAIKWREPDGQTYLGRLGFADTALLLEGSSNGASSTSRSIGYDDLGDFHISQVPAEQLDGRPTLILERPEGEVLVTSAVVHTGVLREVAHQLAEKRVVSPRLATVVVPLAEGAVARARELAAQGPPFDPGDTRLIRHQLLLTESEAIFVFEAESGTELEALLSQTALWAAAAAWRDLIAGPPRLAEVAYKWERPPRVGKIGLGF
jgi:hypothetical protein